MKIVITEQQLEKIKSTILNFLDSNLTPYYGWESPKEYKKDLNSSDEIFFHLNEDEDANDAPHMWYSLHTNTQSYVDKKDSPLLLIPDSAYGALNGYFGELWKPVFHEWFKKNTGLKIKKIDEFAWGRK
jgi:hypothetical protein